MDGCSSSCLVLPIQLKSKNPNYEKGSKFKDFVQSIQNIISWFLKCVCMFPWVCVFKMTSFTINSPSSSSSSLFCLLFFLDLEFFLFFMSCWSMMCWSTVRYNKLLILNTHTLQQSVWTIPDFIVPWPVWCLTCRDPCVLFFPPPQRYILFG